MTIKVELKVEHALIKIHGDFDKFLASTARDILYEFIEHADRNVIIDLSESEHIDPSGIGVVVFLYKRLRSLGFKLELSGMQKQPFSFCKRLHINHILKITKATHL